MSIGFVDSFENGNFSGWCYNNQGTQNTVILKINSSYVTTIQTTVLRSDVAEQLGVNPIECGFNFTFNIHDLPTEGCSVSFHEPINQAPLNNGFFKYERGQLAQTDNHEPTNSKISIDAYLKILNAVKSDISPANFVSFALNKLRSTTTENFVALSYILILGRTPDPDGFSNSLHADLVNENGRRNFLATMVGSEEFRSKRTISNAMRDLSKIG